jgi:type IV secretion system protein VirB2
MRHLKTIEHRLGRLGRGVAARAVTIEQRHKAAALALGVATVIAVVDPALAQSSGTGSAFEPVNKALQMVIDFVNGPFGKSLAIVAVMALGVLSLIGRISWIACGLCVIGIGFLFGAPQIVETLMSSTKGGGGG